MPDKQPIPYVLYHDHRWCVTFSSSGHYGYRHTKIFTQEFQTDVSYSNEKLQGARVATYTEVREDTEQVYEI